MADLILIAVIAIIFVFSLAALGFAAYLLLKFIDAQRKNINYVDKNYVDLVKFTRQQCPDSIYGFNLMRATTKQAEGRNLGQIVGHAVLEVERPIKSFDNEENEEVKKVEGLTRHFITYRPRENEFNLLQPDTWIAQYRIAVIKTIELPHGLNGNVIWAAKAIDFYKYYVYSLSDEEIDKSTMAEKIEMDVKLDMGLLAWENAGGLVQKAIETDPSLEKNIKIKSEVHPRR